MKRLNFNTARGAEFYNNLYIGLVLSPKSLRAPNETRVMGKLLDKLEAIGTPTRLLEGTPQVFDGFTLPEGETILAEGVEGAIVKLEENEFKLMRECLEAGDWTTRGARRTTDLFDFLDAVPSHLNVG